MPADLEAAAALSHYPATIQGAREIEPLAGAGGWSGSRLWRITDHAGRVYCLRRWPGEHPTRNRLRFVHTVLGRVVTDLPVVAAPLPSAGGSTFVEHAGHFWELTPWMPGKADYHDDRRPARLRAAMQTLALFHLAAATVEQRCGTPPALTDRRQHFSRLQHGGLAVIEQALNQPRASALDRRCGQLFTAARQRLASFPPDAWQSPLPELGLQPAIRDVHHDHLLFTGDKVTGLIDFGAMRIDTPLADVARLVGSLTGDDRQSRAAALDAYAELRPLSNDDRRWIGYLDESGLVLGAFNWLTWLYVERRDMGPSELIVRRLDVLIRRLAVHPTG